MRSDRPSGTASPSEIGLALSSLGSNPWRTYAVAIAATLGCFGLTLALPLLRQRTSFLLMIAAIAISAFAGGLGPGLLSLAVSALLFLVFFPRLDNIALHNPDDVRLAIFCGVAAVIIGLAWRLRAAERAARAYAREARELAQKEAEARRIAEEAIAVRDDFVSVAGHELRTPIGAVQLITETLRRETRRQAPPARSEELIERLSASVDRLSRLATSVLDSSQISAGTLVLRRERFDLAEFAAETTQRLTEVARRAGCEIQLILSPVAGEWDRERIGQVITNLLVNATKFGAGRPVEIGVGPENRNARLWVRDHGIGVAPGDQVRIFERFERSDSTRQYSGLGLGLWICREIVRRHGGDIAVQSEPGRGATFTVTLPCGTLMPISPPLQSTAGPRGLESAR
jgi:signal transduction histidine kinase